MRDVSVELFHRGAPLDSVQALLKVLGLNLEGNLDTIEELYAALQNAAAEENALDPEMYAWHISRRSSWQILIASPENVVILISLVKIEFWFGCHRVEDATSIAQQVIDVSRECGCPAWADGVSV